MGREASSRTVPRMSSAMPATNSGIDGVPVRASASRDETDGSSVVGGAIVLLVVVLGAVGSVCGGRRVVVDLSVVVVRTTVVVVRQGVTAPIWVGWQAVVVVFTTPPTVTAGRPTEERVVVNALIMRATPTTMIMIGPIRLASATATPCPLAAAPGWRRPRESSIGSVRGDGEGLVSTRLDGWLVGGAAIALWSLVTTQHLLHARPVPGIGGGVYWLFLGLSAAHFGVSYHLAYTDDEGGVSRHPWTLVALPAVVVGVVLAVWFLPGVPASVGVLRILLSLVFALTIWHYVKQAYGVARLVASLAGVRVTRGQNLVLRYSLYPLWFLSLIELVTKGLGGTMFGYPVGVGLLATWVPTLARAACAVAFVVFAAAVIVMGRQAGRRMPTALWAPHVAGFMWIGFGPGYQSAAIVLASLHALQYLACVNRAERTWAIARSQPQPTLWLLCVFAAAAAGGLFVTNWLAPVLAATVGGGQPTATFAAGLFIMLNLHHYAMDAVMWRSTGSHVKRMLRQRHVQAAAVPHPAPGIAPVRSSA